MALMLHYLKQLYQLNSLDVIVEVVKNVWCNRLEALKLKMLSVTDCR